MSISLRFVVREFEYSEEALEAGKSQITKLANDKKKHFVGFHLDNL